MIKTINILFVVVLFSLFSCSKNQITGTKKEIQITATKAKAGQYSVLSIHCLKDVSDPNADNGGTWEVITDPSSSIGTLTGDNPCVDFVTCGQYVFQYIVESPTCLMCYDTSVLTVNYIGNITASINCN